MNEHKSTGVSIDEMIEYLNRYKAKGREYVHFCAVDPERRKVADAIELVFITDTEDPCIFIVYEGESAFSEEERRCAEECERDAE